MFASYKGKTYSASYYRGKWYLASDKQESEKLGFVRKTPFRFYLSLSDLSEIDDLFEVQVYVVFDTGIDGIPSEWEIVPAFDTIKDGCIKLEYCGGIIPGWRSQEKVVCYKYIELDEIEKAWIVKTDERTKERDRMELDIADLKMLRKQDALAELAEKYFVCKLDE